MAKATKEELAVTDVTTQLKMLGAEPITSLAELRERASDIFGATNWSLNLNHSAYSGGHTVIATISFDPTGAHSQSGIAGNSNPMVAANSAIEHALEAFGVDYSYDEYTEPERAEFTPSLEANKVGEPIPPMMKYDAEDAEIAHTAYNLEQLLRGAVPSCHHGFMTLNVGRVKKPESKKFGQVIAWWKCPTGKNCVSFVEDAIMLRAST